MKSFEVGEKYMSGIGFPYECIGRTEKMVKFYDLVLNKSFSRKVHNYPFGEHDEYAIISNDEYMNADMNAD